MSDDPGSPLPWQGSASGNRCGTPTGGATDSERRDTNWARLSRPTSTAATSFTLAPASFPTQRSPRAPMDGDGQHVRPRSRALLTDDEDDGTYAGDVYSGSLAATGGSRAGWILGR
ncbi:hypothetical protein VPH35_073816 [Triticum aestivum]